ncbi:Sodium/glucose cotransporter [Pseudobythopirellula maris]|uniref:Sodium/glucose cotransporter n=1 Tax=Pseudobythopirellula maris TaxID=2527991 RepID=A0A5C5ZU27_9BACT|nr:sodium:solute symporter [Pseudobythopirellula maris]TWT91062.1 Sodium/glucose cotransporter [Pseudobythopirellula maris]
MLPTADLIVMTLYLLAVVGMGAWFARSGRTSGEFMVAGGKIPGWAVGLSIFGTFLSSNTFLGVPGKAYGSNWNSFVFSLSLPLAAWIAVKVFVPFYREHGHVSAYHHLEQRFGGWARTYGVVCYLLTQVARVGSVLFGASLALTALTGWPQAEIIVAAGVLVTLYTVLGGMEAVIWTDVAQSIVLMVGAVALLAMLLGGMPEGPGQAWEIAVAEDKMSLGSFALDLTSSTFWVVLFYGLFSNLGNFGIDQSYVQRYHTSPSESEARRSVWFGALLYVPVSLLFFAIGTAAYGYYQTHPAMLAEVQTQVAASVNATADEPVGAAELSAAQIGDKVLPHFIVKELPVGATGLLIAAIFAAAMSSIDTSLNSSATVLLLDIYQRYFRPDCDERESMTVLYAGTALVGAIGVGVALAMIGVSSVLDAWWTLSGVFSGGLMGLFLLGLISRRAGSPAAACGVTIGLVVIAWVALPGHFPEWLRSPLHTQMTIVVGTLTIFFVGLLFSTFLEKKRSYA